MMAFAVATDPPIPLSPPIPFPSPPKLADLGLLVESTVCQEALLLMLTCLTEHFWKNKWPQADSVESADFILMDLFPASET